MKRFISVILLTCLMGVLPGAMSVYAQESDALNHTSRTLTGILCENVIGSMYGYDYYFDIRPEEIYAADFFEEDRQHISVDFLPLAPEKWQEMKSLVMEMLPYLQPGLEREETQEGPSSELEVIEMLDGPNYTRFSLSWKTEDGKEELISYFTPLDQRRETLMALMMEAAHPTGREIPEFEAPIINGLELSIFDGLFGKKESFYSIRSYADSWRLNATQEFFLLTRKNTVDVSPDQWQEILTLCDELGLLQREKRRSEASPYIKLYYSSGYFILPEVTEEDFDTLITFLQELL